MTASITLTHKPETLYQSLDRRAKKEAMKAFYVEKSPFYHYRKATLIDRIDRGYDNTGKCIAEYIFRIIPSR